MQDHLCLRGLNDCIVPLSSRISIKSLVSLKSSLHSLMVSCVDQELIFVCGKLARPWATPSRLSHEDQHKSSLDDGELGGASLSPRRATPKESKQITLFDERVQSSKGHDNLDKPTEDDEGGSISLEEYVHNHGFNSKSRSSLTQLIEAHAPKSNALSDSDQSEKHGEMAYPNLSSVILGSLRPLTCL